MSKVTEKRKVEHPLEDVFDITPGTTEVMVTKTDTTGELKPHETYDEKDDDIEKRLQIIADAAIDAYDNQVLIVEELEDQKYAARNMEVANALLATALAAIKERADIKKHKDKLVASFKKAPSTVNQNLIVGSRNEILKRLLQEENQNN